MKLKHVKTLLLDSDTRLFFTIENESDSPFFGNLLLEIRSWWGIAIANFDMPTKVIDGHSFASFYVDVPQNIAKRFSSFKWIWHRKTENEGLLVFKGKGEKIKG